MKHFDLTEKELQILETSHKLTKDKWAADRIKAVIALSNEWTLDEVAEILLLDTETLRNYLKLFKTGGIEELTHRKYKGKQPKLSASQLNELKEHLSEVTYMSIASIISYVKVKYEVEYQISGMTNLVRNLGFVYKKPDIAPGKVDIAKQLEFMQKFEELRRSGEPVYSMDGCHPQHNSLPQYGWILKGHTKKLPSNTGRKRVNIQGAVNLDTHELLSTVHETLNKQSTIDLLKKISKKHKSCDKVHVIVDNAGYYHADLVKEYLRNSNVNLVFLPPYSPNLSLVERIWRYLKKELLYNKYYHTFKEFKEATLKFLRRSHKRAFKKLLVEKFHFARLKTSTLKLCSEI